MKVIISISNFLLFFLILESYWITSVKAQCVQGDVSVQYSISGSQKPSQRTNDVTMNSDPKCRGNASVSTGVQGHIGPNTAEQNRRVDQVQQGSNKYPQVPNGTTVQIRSNVQVDVDNPADRFPHHPKK
ncbi:hypothetical protein cce_1574 [Crocosphaera subtropica ATCC 51142]|uniref:Uncharacterized protein n=1 Tax=Crocosphaera subtropica (strain ATCC 51142 / BH68) TaxID=43989 RepID=B1WXT7_CROS5|nr:hypothetical protein [Crocosphaera subtropica]ACB50924.1 hypothetical protein cce_1574 [Crocosphaera subtropica ATCC 51142]